jgi:hypothetical protein
LNLLKRGKRLIDLKDGHTTVIGLTRSGKTVAVKESLKGLSCGALFFNTQLETMPNGFIRADGTSTMGKIKAAIEKGYKVNFVPSTDLMVQQKQLECIIQCLYDGRSREMVLVVDEVHLFNDRDIKRQLIRVATTGLRFGIHGVWISQRPAKIENTLMTQSNKFVMFQLNMEFQYLKGHHIPGEEVAAILKKAGKYAYCEFDWREINGPFKV